MNDSFDERKQKHEENEREAFERITSRQGRSVKKILLLTFGIIGAVFIILGAILFFAGAADEDGFLIGIVFMPLGALYLLIGIILYFAIPEKYSYERYKKRLSRYGGVNLYDMAVTLRMAEEKIAELEKRIEAIEEHKDK